MLRREPTLWLSSLQSTTPRCNARRHVCQLGFAVCYVWLVKRRAPSLRGMHGTCLHNSFTCSFLPLQPSYDSPGRRAFELLLRRLQAMPSRPAVLLLQMYPWWQAFGDGATQGLYYREPETEMTVLAQASWRACLLPNLLLRGWAAGWMACVTCDGQRLSALPTTCFRCEHPLQYYDMPVVSLRAAAWHLMSAGIEGFKVRPLGGIALCAGCCEVHDTGICSGGRSQSQSVRMLDCTCQHPSNICHSTCQHLPLCLPATYSQVDKVLAQPNRNFGNTSHVVPLANVTTERGLYFYYDW